MRAAPCHFHPGLLWSVAITPTDPSWGFPPACMPGGQRTATPQREWVSPHSRRYLPHVSHISPPLARRRLRPTIPPTPTRARHRPPPHPPAPTPLALPEPTIPGCRVVIRVGLDVDTRDNHREAVRPAGARLLGIVASAWDCYQRVAADARGILDPLQRPATDADVNPLPRPPPPP